MPRVPTNSPKVVALDGALGGPSAIYPNVVAAARIVGVSRQAIHKAIQTGERVKGYYWRRYVDYLAEKEKS